MRFPLWALLLSLTLSSQLYAQQFGVLAGRVRHTATHEPVAGAVALIRSLNRADQTDSGGVFYFKDLPFGTYTVEFSAIDFETSQEELVVSADSGAWEVELAPAPVRSEELVITAVSEHRSIVDGCCRVESLNEEIVRSASVAPSATEALARYTTCTPMQFYSAVDHSGTVRLRGGHAAYTLRLVEDLPMIGALSGLYRFQQLPSIAIDNIRIVEGSSAAQYGNRAVIGVLDLALKNPTPTSIWQLSASSTAAAGSSFASSFPERNLAGSFTGTVEDVGVAAFVSYKGHEMVVEDNSLVSHHPRISQINGFAKAVIPVSSGSELTLGVLALSEERRGVLFMDHLVTEPVRGKGSGPIPLHNLDAPGYAESINSTAVNTFLKYTIETGQDASLTLSGLYGRSEQDSYYGQKYLHGVEELTFGRAAYSLIRGDHNIIIGAEFTGESLKELPLNDTGSILGIGYQFTIPALYAQDQIALAESWDVLLGARFDQHSRSGSIVSPRAALQWKPGAQWEVRLMSGMGLKGESLFHEEQHILHGDLRFRDNPTLKAERSFTNNLEVTYSYIFGEVAGEANFNFFQTTIWNKSIPSLDSLRSGVSYFLNSEAPAIIRGFEFQTRPSLSEQFTLGLAMSYNDYHITNALGSSEHVALSPGMNVDLSLLWQDRTTGWAVETWNSLVGPIKLLPNRYRESSPTYALLNLRIEKQFGDLRINLGAMNLLDVTQDDTMPTVYPQDSKVVSTNVWGPLEGREFVAGVVWQF